MPTKAKKSAPRAEREARILRLAEAAFLAEGEQNLQMRDIAQRAEISLATLYQHFPSKDHLLARIALGRQQRMTSRLESATIEGDTPGERAGAVMAEELRNIQRNPEIAAALLRVTNAPNRATSEYVTGIRTAMEATVLRAIEQGGKPPSPEQVELLPVFFSVCYGAMSGWLSGMFSSEQAREQIRIAQRLFDLPPRVARQRLLEP